VIFTAKPGQWWNAEDKRTAYYLCMRVCYEMPARDALAATRKMYEMYPEFMADPIGTLRNAVRGKPND
jgi:hypothetical protein